MEQVKKTQSILIACAEFYPFAKTGGLADMISDLTDQLKRQGFDIRIIMPAYDCVKKHFESNLEEIAHVKISEVFSYKILASKSNNYPYSFVFIDPIYRYNSRAIYPKDRKIRLVRFYSLCHATAYLIRNHIDYGWKPDILHAHDWHTGLSFEMLPKDFPIKKVFTIHNASYSGSFRGITSTLSELKIKYNKNSLIGGDTLSFLERGIQCADHITTVSEKYAIELTTRDPHVRLPRFLHISGKEVTAIANGINYSRLSKRKENYNFLDKAIDLNDKGECKLAIQKNFGLAVEQNAMLVGFTNRIADQKNISLILNVIPELVKRGFQFAFHAQGNKEYEKKLTHLQSLYPKSIMFVKGHDQKLEKLILAGSDLYFAISKYEPFGYSALYAMYFGSIPIIIPTGGYFDTTKDILSDPDFHGNSFHYTGIGGDSLVTIFEKIQDVMSDVNLKAKLQKQVKSCKFSWSKSIKKYKEIYDSE